MAEYTLKVRRYEPETGDGALLGGASTSTSSRTALGARRHPPGQGPRRRLDRRSAARAGPRSAAPAGCGSTASRRSPATPSSARPRAERARRRRDRRRADGQHAGDQGPDRRHGAVHWKKVQRVTPWLLPDGDAARARVHRAARVDDRRHPVDGLHPVRRLRLGLPLDGGRPADFIGPAALAKAYRFVGDPRDAETSERLNDLAEDPHGIYDCTHCFNCIEACPKGVAPMDQIMRLRRRAGDDHEINDRNNGHRHEKAFVKIIEKKGTLDEAELLPRLLRAGRSRASSTRSAALRSCSTRCRPRSAAICDRQDALAAEADPGSTTSCPDDARTGQADLRRTPRSTATELNLYITRRGGRRARARRGGARAEPERRADREENDMKVAYWPGCVSRGFTPELHGSMALVADRCSASSWSSSTAPTAAAPA